MDWFIQELITEQQEKFKVGLVLARRHNSVHSIVELTFAEVKFIAAKQSARAGEFTSR